MTIAPTNPSPLVKAANTRLQEVLLKKLAKRGNGHAK